MDHTGLGVGTATQGSLGDDTNSTCGRIDGHDDCDTADANEDDTASDTAAIQHDTAAIQQPPRPHIGEQFLIDTAAIQQADTAVIQSDTADLMYRRGSEHALVDAFESTGAARAPQTDSMCVRRFRRFV